MLLPADILVSSVVALACRIHHLVLVTLDVDLAAVGLLLCLNLVWGDVRHRLHFPLMLGPRGVPPGVLD